MIWRSRCLPCLPLSRTIPNSLAAAQLRASSTLRRSNPNIANILAAPPAFDEQVVTAAGSVRTVRNQKYRSFVELGDGSTTQTLQAVLDPAQAVGYVFGFEICRMRVALISSMSTVWGQARQSKSPVYGNVLHQTKNRVMSSRLRTLGS